ncbi:Protein kinase domain - like 10 [Theobroma cacao]|nr:Protein kinase domain - like 10 [Theobroma cacao]
MTSTSSKKEDLGAFTKLYRPQVKSFKDEIQMLTEVRHRNIIKLYGYCSRGGACTWSMNRWREQRGVELGWATRVKIVQRLAHAISYLCHDCSPPIIHRDISLNNALLVEKFEPRFSNFGIARLLNLNSSNWTTVVGSYG